MEPLYVFMLIIFGLTDLLEAHRAAARLPVRSVTVLAHAGHA
jgi:hypothetical protein